MYFLISKDKHMFVNVFQDALDCTLVLFVYFITNILIALGYKCVILTSEPDRIMFS